MPRVSRGPRYYASKRAYVANINKEAYVLLRDVDETPENDRRARSLYDHVLAKSRVQVEGDHSPVRAALAHYLDWLRTRPDEPVAPATVRRARRFLKTFSDLHGDLKVREVTAAHVEGWLEVMRQPRPHKGHGGLVAWGRQTAAAAARALRAAFRYLADNNLATRDPFATAAAANLRSLVKAKKAFDDKRPALTRAEYEALLAAALGRSEKDFAHLLILLWETGARPSELILANAEEWFELYMPLGGGEYQKAAGFRIRHDEPSNRGRFKLIRFQKHRDVRVPKALWELFYHLREKYEGGKKFPINRRQIEEAKKDGKAPPPAGRPVTPLFRAQSGEPYSIHTVNVRLRSLVRQVNRDAGREVVRKGISPYSFRHAFVTRWVCRGLSVNTLAEMLGTSEKMIREHYSHLFTQHGVMQDALEEFRQAEGRGPRGPSGPASAGGPDGG